MLLLIYLTPVTEIKAHIYLVYKQEHNSGSFNDVVKYVLESFYWGEFSLDLKTLKWRTYLAASISNFYTTDVHFDTLEYSKICFPNFSIITTDIIVLSLFKKE